MSSQPTETTPYSPSRTLHGWHNYIMWGGREQWWGRRVPRRAIALYRDDWLNTARSYADSYAGVVTDLTGRTYTEQLAQMGVLAIRHGVWPKQYYSYQLYRPDRYEQAGDYIYHIPKVDLNNYLIERTSDDICFNMKDKRSWFAWALDHDVPTPQPVASFEDGDITQWNWNGDPQELPKYDLFSIWVDAYRGEGAQVWLFDNGGYVDEDDSSTRVTGSQLLDLLAEKSKQRPVILMERIRNHQEMRGLTSGGLATCRFVTGRFPGDNPEPILANLKMPRGTSIVDDISAGGIAAPVSLRDGTLGPAVSGFPESSGDEFHAHPDTGETISGTQLPHWDEVVDLALRTHRRMPNAPFVGWDITVAEQGPIIVEPNDGWGASTAEKPSGRPLRHTLYEPMYDAWMLQLVDEVDAG